MKSKAKEGEGYTSFAVRAADACGAVVCIMKVAAADP
jgi:hypothetical protein